MITDYKNTEIFCAVDEFSRNFDSEIEKNLLSASGKQRRRRKATMSDSEIMTVQLMFHLAFLHPLYPRHPQGPLPNGGFVQPFRGVGKPRVFRHDVLPENECLRQVQRRELCGFHYDTRLSQRQAIHEQGLQRFCHRRQGDDVMVPRVQAALRMQRPGRNHHFLPHPGQYTLDLTSRPQATYLLTWTTASGKTHTVRLMKMSYIFTR